MKELTFAEVKQGLLCCTVNKNCDNCPLYQGGDLGTVSAGDLVCSQMLMGAAWNVIRTMEQDLIASWRKADNWEAACEHLEKELHTLHEAQDRKGKWTYYSSTMMECSICGKHVARHKFKFCPQCGHPMQEGIANE